MKITQLDHLVLTVRDIQVSCDFYTRILGMQLVEFAGGRKALKFGSQKINLHQHRQEFKPKAALPTPGSADLCFLTEVPVSEVANHLKRNQIEIIEGPVERTGAEGPILSIYLRDPDGNLLEIANRK
ncbi:MAG: VOC family protein [Candidatus Thiodiazotropha taylori]|nr:VOC family protein [Candidatus Thiodiazotropha taylori]MCG8069064.1 VOC family protein [Candidatus Thiodiazotropha taylori]MCG8074430.1 VOC family protein [Candidatus Thiodiazotropha taylori]MCG8083855.1 VOC family protein [Candidatus Thiodiazotropha taylori]MCG8084530.1 VOC family protein [Candidatus Thiodiazotropha taylori]